MSAKVSKFKLGLFVIVGVMLGAGAIMWVAASQFMEGGLTYVTFFNESVQGLQKDSVVKYRGVDVGRVMDIRVAPDYRLIEVVMHIRFVGDLSKEMVAQLRSVGITGISFVELDRRKPDEPVSRISINFAAEYPIIPSRPSEIAEIFSLVDKITSQLKNVDFKAMGDGITSLVKELENMVKDGRMAKALNKLVTAADGLDRLVKEANRKIDQVDVGGISDEADAALKEARKLMSELRQTLAAMKLDAAGQKINRVLDKAADVADNTDEIVVAARGQVDKMMTRLLALTVNLERASRSLDKLLHRLERRPSDIIWGGQPQRRKE